MIDKLYGAIHSLKRRIRLARMVFREDPHEVITLRGTEDGGVEFTCSWMEGYAPTPDGALTAVKETWPLIPDTHEPETGEGRRPKAPEKPTWANWIEHPPEPHLVTGVECRGCHGAVEGLTPGLPAERAGVWDELNHSPGCVHGGDDD